jgi:hypothetical protein
MPAGNPDDTGGGGGPYVAPQGYAPGLQLNLNRVIGNVIYSGDWYDAQKAANIWANTDTYLDLLGALNYKNGTSGLGLNEVCRELTGFQGRELDADGASQYFV